MKFEDYLQEQLQDPEFRKEYNALEKCYKALEKLIEETENKEKYSKTPSCNKCIYGDKCPVYWHFGNAACNIIYRNKYI